LVKSSQKDESLKNESMVQMKAISSDITKNENKSEPKLCNKTTLADETSSKPKIKITDENELTISYASDNTPSLHNVTESGRKLNILEFN
jgi:hypothetical protein